MLHKKAGIQLRDLRIKERMTQEQLAEKLGVSRNLISAIETATRKGSFEFYLNAANYFNVSFDYFFFEGLNSNEKILSNTVFCKMQHMNEHDQKFMLSVLDAFNTYKENLK